ncbi:replication initiation protein [Zooshikella ganghwensis]|uniref:Replication initiation protein n=1 Tax=Zooshikella ganghwensis TaxID=202772 RepID=A0A4P9VGL0_9GAMM|nr:replication initiation protein [Zooshikella ganghwensis]RDH41410.1 replication initiation protein [Zooshikella ganghwensis]
MKRQNRVTKANQLIQAQLVESKVSLSVREQKIVLAIISLISPEDDNLKDYELSIKKLCELTGIDESNLYRNRMRDIATNLTTSSIRIIRPEEPDGALYTTWFSDVDYRPREGVVRFSISKKLRPYLLQLKSHFTTYQLKQITSLRSTNAIRMYELLRQFYPEKSEEPVVYSEIKVANLRAYLGIEDSKYKRFNDFKKRVLDHVREELTDKTDLTFNYKTKTHGRKVIAIAFSIFKNNVSEPVDEFDEYEQALELEKTLEDKVAEYLPARLVVTVFNKFDRNRIERNFDYTVVQIELGDVKNPGKYLWSAINEDYAKEDSSSSLEDEINDISWVDRRDNF